MFKFMSLKAKIIIFIVLSLVAILLIVKDRLSM